MREQKLKSGSLKEETADRRGQVYTYQVERTDSAVTAVSETGGKV
jgi:hypothetical protein